MYLFFALILFILLFYYVFSFLRLMHALNRIKILPQDKEDLNLIRRHPDVKKLESINPVVSNQKFGLTMYSAMLVFVGAVFFITLFTNFGEWYLLMFAIIPLLQLNQFLNVFAVLEDGIIIGAKFLSWNEIKGYEFIAIDLDHRFYGYHEDFNEGAYEVKFHQTILSKSGVVANDAMKQRLETILSEKIGKPTKLAK